MLLDKIKIISKSTLKEICHRWRIKELALFGSILRTDFNIESDIDILVTFFDDASWSLWDIVKLKNELTQLFEKKVDLVEKSALSNPFLRYEILNNQQVIYESN